MKKIIANSLDSDKAVTSRCVVFHCPVLMQRTPLDDWAVEQISYLSSIGWRLSRFRSASTFHLLSPATGEA